MSVRTGVEMHFTLIEREILLFRDVEKACYLQRDHRKRERTGKKVGRTARSPQPKKKKTKRPPGKPGAPSYFPYSSYNNNRCAELQLK